jgi:hypothetical protein
MRFRKLNGHFKEADRQAGNVEIIKGFVTVNEASVLILTQGI